ncbi:MAG: hypothetical protein D3918_01250 [Candidatus Electrothrix sp. AX2]|nr:hypothetical protein [Candidatus Electrothrix gigas]
MASEGKTLSILNVEPDGYSPRARALLDRFAQVKEGPLSRSELLLQMNDIDILIVRLAHRIDEELIHAASRLTTIVTATTGLNHIDMQAAEQNNIAVLSLRGEREFLDTIYATVEHTWALLLALIRHMPFAHEHAVRGGWERDLYKGTELHGRTLGLIGLGRIGSKVANIATSFGMKVIGYDTESIDNLPKAVQQVPLDNVLAEADIVSLHVSYSQENHGMIGKEQLMGMKKGALLINTSRGELIHEAALLQSLEQGHLGGAALDVLCGENNHWLDSTGLLEYARKNRNLIITPHIGGCTYDSMEKTEIFMAEKLLRHLT